MLIVFIEDFEKEEEVVNFAKKNAGLGNFKTIEVVCLKKSRKYRLRDGVIEYSRRI